MRDSDYGLSGEMVVEVHEQTTNSGIMVWYRVGDRQQPHNDSRAKMSEERVFVARALW